MLLGAIATQPVLDVLLAAGLTWAAHSSVAVVLLVMSLAAKGVVPPEAAFALVLGANLGTAINPVLEGVSGDDPVARRLPIGNLLNRRWACVVALVLLPRLARVDGDDRPRPGARGGGFPHRVQPACWRWCSCRCWGRGRALLRRLLPARVEAGRSRRGRAIWTQAALETPPIALAGAAREALRMADALEAMLTGAADALIGSDRQRIAEVRRLDNVLDRLNSAIRAYLTRSIPRR